MDWFRDDGIFMPMINDTGRNIFYKQAIERAAPGKIVVDIGTGTGLLSVLAAQAGASKVIAVEQNLERAKLAQQMFEKLNLTDRVELVVDNFLNTNIVGDVYVSETINTQIFGEDILQLANHAVRHGGTFIPSYFEVSATVYVNHPIFVLCQTRSDAFEFQPDIEINSEFETAINQQFQQVHSLDNTLYRANLLNGLFRMLPQFTDLRLQTVWRTDPVLVDLNKPTSFDQLKLIIPADKISSCKQDLYVVLFWKARYQDIVMDSSDTWFGNVSKTVLQRCRQPGHDIVTWYDPELRDWKFRF